jgi:hypothetical protein
MFWTELGEKCIIVQFLRMEKEGKAKLSTQSRIPKLRDWEQRRGEKI